MNQETPRWVLKPLVADELYTDRQEFLDFFYKEARRAATRRSMSTVLLGRRRMGKTEIFKRLARKEGIRWSNREQLDGLLTYLGLRTLPNLETPKYS